MLIRILLLPLSLWTGLAVVVDITTSVCLGVWTPLMLRTWLAAVIILLQVSSWNRLIALVWLWDMKRLLSIVGKRAGLSLMVYIVVYRLRRVSQLMSLRLMAWLALNTLGIRVVRMILLPLRTRARLVITALLRIRLSLDAGRTRMQMPLLRNRTQLCTITSGVVLGKWWLS